MTTVRINDFLIPTLLKRVLDGQDPNSINKNIAPYFSYIIWDSERITDWGSDWRQINNDRADKRQSPLPLLMHSADLSGALFIRDDEFIIHRDIQERMEQNIQGSQQEAIFQHSEIVETSPISRLHRRDEGWTRGRRWTTLNLRNHLNNRRASVGYVFERSA